MIRRLIPVLLLLSGCGDDSNPGHPDGGPDAPPRIPTARFAPATGAMNFADVPYPSDLYKNASGGIQLSSLPAGGQLSPNTLAIMNDGLAQDHGFGVTTAIFFGVDAPASFAPDAAALMQNVHLVDLATGTEVPLLPPAYDAAQGRIWAQPVTRLAQNHAYGAWIDPALGLSSTAAFDAAKGTATPSDAALAKAHDQLVPLWSPPASIPRDHAVVATVFTTHEVSSELVAIRNQVGELMPTVLAANPAPMAVTNMDAAWGTPGTNDHPGLVNPSSLSTETYAVLHGNVAEVVHGAVNGPNYLSADPGSSGTMTFDSTGAPVVKGQQPIYFTLVIPKNAPNPLPIVIFQPGIQQVRSEAFGIADALAAQGIGMITIDLLFHGDRYHMRRDTVNNVSRATTPDGMGDDVGQLPALQYLAAGPFPATIRSSDPQLLRDDFRQSVADLMVIERLITTSGANMQAIQAIRDADTTNLGSLAFDHTRIVVMAEGFGMPIALTTAAVDGNITAVCGSQPSGGILFPFFSTTPAYATRFIPLFGGLFNIADQLASNPERHPMLTLYQQILEPGDALALLPDAPLQHTFLVQPFSDEVASNQTEEMIEFVMGIPALGGGMYRYQQLQTGTLPATANVGGNRTIGVVQYMPATWDLFLRHQSIQGYMPGFPPFMKWPDPGMMIQNPIVSAQAQLVGFVHSHFTDGGGIPTIPNKM